MRNVAAVILAGGQGERLSVLSAQRAKPAVPFAGKYRIIDFTLSNCVNSGIYRVAVLTQYRPHSLNDHIGIGRPWDLDRMRGGVRMLQPYLGRQGQRLVQGHRRRRLPEPVGHRRLALRHAADPVGRPRLQAGLQRHARLSRGAQGGLHRRRPAGADGRGASLRHAGYRSATGASSASKKSRPSRTAT